MTLAGDSRVRFSELEQKELTEYRPVNRVALTACVLGSAASLALIHPVLCIVPLVGAIIALVALRQLGSAENKQSGRSLALVGLYLSVLFGSWAVARETSRELRLYGPARQFAEDWFALLREGKLYEAHQLTIGEESRAASGVSLKNHYAAPEETDKGQTQPPGSADPETARGMEMMAMRPHVEFEEFFGQPLVKRLRDLGSKARYEFRENVQILVSGANAVQVEMVFLVSEEGDGRLQSFPIKIMLSRNLKPGIAADWQVTRVTNPNST